MSEQDPRLRRAIRGTIHRRLLINALVDPDEAAHHLPGGLRPHVSGEGTVVGCCLLSIDSIRPAGIPARFGSRLRAAAHRISVEWDDDAGTSVGVYVPVRHTDSRPARMLGGRWFPGVHRRATIEVAENEQCLDWLVEPQEDADRFGIHVAASIPSTAPVSPGEPIGGTCLAAAVGLSPDHRGVLEAARMDPDHRVAQLVEIDRIDSQFLAGFVSARPAPSYLMRDVDVRWTPARAPRIRAHEVSA
ncbi:MAG: hypothetical protein M3527_00025 [Actinomycetota bacterium]|nr:hypothetical protein [Acidimicrobiia bacterium]MDQ3292830.1 hypothetical protein [Actinomycetota bacterium]